jgi:nitroimidazol reductase NimA-like FMN-containing flavoprotein (pyridoxamine 5'-phosphate oxidase superfamily)
MTYIAAGIEVLTDDECWTLLDQASVGRLAIDIAGKPDIFPINFIVDGNTLTFRTGAGTKFAASALLHDVAFEIDGYEPTNRTAWSVVVKGRAHEVEGMDEIYAAEDLPLFPWAAHPKPNFVRITPTETTGRRFHVVDDVSPDSSIGERDHVQ